jgi:hypothetical protein
MRSVENVAMPPSSFWSDFVTHNWEKHPRVLKQPFARLLFTSGQVFQGMVRACRPRADDNRPVRFFIEHARPQAFGKYLPRRADRSLAHYVARVNATLRGRRFALVVNGYQVSDPIAWLQVKEFLSGLYTQVGIPGTFAEIAIDKFVSPTYASTRKRLRA